MKKLVILDTVGTIIAPLKGTMFLEDPFDQQPINQWIYNEHLDAQFVSLTNQGGVAAGYKTFQDCINETKYMMEGQPFIQKSVFTIDFDGKKVVEVLKSGLTMLFDTETSFRKPDPGGIEYLIGIINKKDVIMYGDRDEDAAAAKLANIDFVYV